TASATITCSATNTISPSAATVSLAQTQTFSVSFCSAAGATIAWDVDGIPTGNSTIGTIAPSSANTALYTAPIDLPTPSMVVIHAANGTINASGSVTIVS